MRKLILAALAASLSIPAMTAPAAAQSWREDRRDFRQDRREFRRDRRDFRQDRREFRRDRRDFRQDRRDYRDRQWGRNDWRGYRDRNRAIYSRGTWRAPFAYQRFGIGTRIGRPFYGQRYWINDPWRYRLPPVRANARWVRHYDDALLVDYRRGIVLDVIRSFYW